MSKDLASLVRCEVTASIGGVVSDPSNRIESEDSDSGLILDPNRDVGVFTSLVNFMECSKNHCSDYPDWSFRNTRPEYDAWLDNKLNSTTDT